MFFTTKQEQPDIELRTQTARILDSGSWAGQIVFRVEDGLSICTLQTSIGSQHVSFTSTEIRGLTHVLTRQETSMRSTSLSRNFPLTRIEFARRISTIRSWNRGLARKLNRQLPFGTTLVLLGADFLFLPARMHDERPDVEIVHVDPLDEDMKCGVKRFGCSIDVANQLAAIDRPYYSDQRESVDLEYQELLEREVPHALR